MGPLADCLMGSDGVLGLATDWLLAPSSLCPGGSVSSYAPEKELQGAGVQASGGSGRVMASDRQSSALRSCEAGKHHKPGGRWKQKPAAVRELNPLHLLMTPAATWSHGAKC